MNTPPDPQQALTEMDRIREYVSKMTPEEIQQIRDKYKAKESPAQNGGDRNLCGKCGLKLIADCDCPEEQKYQPTPEPSRQQGEWKVGVPVYDRVTTGYLCPILNKHQNVVGYGYGKTKEESEATAKRICEDHNRVFRLMGKSAAQEDYINSLRAELKAAQDEIVILKSNIT